MLGSLVSNFLRPSDEFDLEGGSRGGTGPIAVQEFLGNFYNVYVMKLECQRNKSRMDSKFTYLELMKNGIEIVSGHLGVELLLERCSQVKLSLTELRTIMKIRGLASNFYLFSSSCVCSFDRFDVREGVERVA